MVSLFYAIFTKFLKKSFFSGSVNQNWKMFGTQTSSFRPTTLFGGTNTLTSTSNPMKDFEVVQPPDDSIQALKFSPAANFLVSGSWDNMVYNFFILLINFICYFSGSRLGNQRGRKFGTESSTIVARTRFWSRLVRCKKNFLFLYCSYAKVFCFSGWQQNFRRRGRQNGSSVGFGE